MTKIKGKWITREDTELKILEKLLKKGPLNMPAIEDRKGKDPLSHASVRNGIFNLLEEKKVIVVEIKKTIPKRPVKTFEITPAGIYQYLQWIFPEEKKAKYSDEIWESIKKSRRKFVRKNITPHYFPIIDKYWEKLEQIKETPFWWFGGAFGKTELNKAPYGKDIVNEPNIPISFIFSFNVTILDLDFDYNLSYELKVSQVFLLLPTPNKNLLNSTNTSEIESFNHLQKIISDTITFLLFYDMICNLIQGVLVLRPTNNQEMVSERTNILNILFTMIKSDKKLQAIFREHLAIIYSKIKTNKTVSYLFQNSS